MSLFGWVGQKMLARIEELPSVKAAAERHERTGPVLRAAMSAACGEPDDDAAKAELIERVGGRPEEVVEVLRDSLLLRRDTYVTDRAYRLLAAVASNSKVEPPPVWRASLFGEEAGLGRVPMKDAFRRLAEIEPRLRSVERMAELPVARADEDRLPKEIGEALRPLVGGTAEHENELLRSTLASSLAHQYLWIMTGEQAFGISEMSYFQAPRKLGVASGVLKGGRRPSQ
jgi:hypothetical protein